MIKVSVIMLTYNHEKFIKEAIDSVLMQRTSFKYELIIGDDCSTDDTREIIKEYYTKYPHIIKLNLNVNNVGERQNFKKIFSISRGKYLAFLEGDDYWTDEKKLEKQVEFLDKNLDCSFCAHSYKIYNDYNGRFVGNRVFSNKRFDLEDFLKGDANNNREPNPWYMRTLSIMFRREVVENPPEVYYQMPYGDYIFHIVALEKGLGYCAEDIMGVYRINPESTTNKNPSKHDERVLQCREIALKYVEERFKPYLKQSIKDLIVRKEHSYLLDYFSNPKNDDKIVSYFMEHSLTTIAIYGAGTLGNLLANKFKEMEVKVLLFIDKNVTSCEARVVIKPEEVNENLKVDAIIITPVFDFDNIKELLLKNKAKSPIISLNELLV